MAKDTIIQADEVLVPRGPSTRGAQQILRKDGNTRSEQSDLPILEKRSRI